MSSRLTFQPSRPRKRPGLGMSSAMGSGASQDERPRGRLSNAETRTDFSHELEFTNKDFFNKFVDDFDQDNFEYKT